MGVAEAEAGDVRRAVVMFAGMGGSTEGISQAGYDVVAAVDGWQQACIAHRRWHPDVLVVRAWCEDADRVLAGTRPDAIWASPSCKPYSLANRTATRGQRHPEYYPLGMLVHQAMELGARWLVIENVPGLVWSSEGKIEIASLHYAATARGLVWNWTMVRSDTCGVEQLRKRVIIVVGPSMVTIPDGLSLNARVGSEQRTVIAEGSRHSAAATWKRKGKGYALPRSVTSSGEASSSSVNPHNGEANHAGRTLAECCALQCVPLWPLEGLSKTSAHALVGNAVPPPLARVVMEAVTRADVQHEARAAL